MADINNESEPMLLPQDEASPFEGSDCAHAGEKDSSRRAEDSPQPREPQDNMNNYPSFDPTHASYDPVADEALHRGDFTVIEFQEVESRTPSSPALSIASSAADYMTQRVEVPDAEARRLAQEIAPEFWRRWTAVHLDDVFAEYNIPTEEWYEQIKMNRPELRLPEWPVVIFGPWSHLECLAERSLSVVDDEAAFGTNERNKLKIVFNGILAVVHVLSEPGTLNFVHELQTQVLRRASNERSVDLNLLIVHARHPLLSIRQTLYALNIPGCQQLAPGHDGMGIRPWRRLLPVSLQDRLTTAEADGASLEQIGQFALDDMREITTISELELAQVLGYAHTADADRLFADIEETGSLADTAIGNPATNAARVGEQALAAANHHSLLASSERLASLGISIEALSQVLEAFNPQTEGAEETAEPPQPVHADAAESPEAKKRRDDEKKRRRKERKEANRAARREAERAAEQKQAEEAGAGQTTQGVQPVAPSQLGKDTTLHDEQAAEVEALWLTNALDGTCDKRIPENTTSQLPQSPMVPTEPTTPAQELAVTENVEASTRVPAKLAPFTSPLPDNQVLQQHQGKHGCLPPVAKLEVDNANTERIMPGGDISVQTRRGTCYGAETLAPREEQQAVLIEENPGQKADTFALSDEGLARVEEITAEIERMLTMEQRLSAFYVETGLQVVPLTQERSWEAESMPPRAEILFEDQWRISHRNFIHTAVQQFGRPRSRSLPEYWRQPFGRPPVCIPVVYSVRMFTRTG